MEELTQKQLVARLNEVLDGLGVPGLHPSQVVNPVTKVTSIQARNPRKAMLKMFKEMDYTRQVHELIALEARLQHEETQRILRAQQDTVASEQAKEVQAVKESNDSSKQ